MAPARTSSRGKGHSSSRNEIWRGRGVSETANEKQDDGQILVLGAETLWQSSNPFLSKNTDASLFKGVLLRSVFLLVFIPCIIAWRVNKNLIIKK